MSERKNEIPQPENPEKITDWFGAYDELVRILRRECPWDREQTHKSISHLLIEECYETLEAIDNNDDEELAKELGDLFLHVVMHAYMAEQRGAFNIIDVMKKSHAKLVSRHPHVFGDINVSGSDNVIQNWEALKMKEGQRSILQGVPKHLCALLRAQRMQEKAANIGFDWDKKEDVWKKVDEEYAELKKEILENNTDKALNELGDFLFSLVNAGRFENLIAEEALQKTNEKFAKRFKYIEEQASQNGKNLKDMTLGEMDELWDEAKEKFGG